MEKSVLQQARMAYIPKLPEALKGLVKVKEGAPTQSVDNQEEIRQLFPNTYGMPVVEFEPSDTENSEVTNVGIILSGGQAPGGHNVITGLFDTIKKMNPENKLYGFILGPGGLVDHKYIEITKDFIDGYRNTGGFDMIGSGRTKLERAWHKGSRHHRRRRLQHQCLRPGRVLCGKEVRRTGNRMPEDNRRRPEEQPD